MTYMLLNESIQLCHLFSPYQKKKHLKEVSPQQIVFQTQTIIEPSTLNLISAALHQVLSLNLLVFTSEPAAGR